MSGMLTANHSAIGLRSKVRRLRWRIWLIHFGSPFHQLIWSTTPLAVKWSGEGPGFLLGVLARMGLATFLCLALVAVLRLEFPWHQIARRAYYAGALGAYAAMLLVYWAAQYVPSGLISVLFGLVLTFFSATIGITAGAVQGYFGGRVDLIFQRFLEIWSSIPLRNRRDDQVTRITENATRWMCEGITGTGMSEYLDLIIDDLPVGISANV